MLRHFRGPRSVLALLTVLPVVGGPLAADADPGKLGDDPAPRPRLRVSETSFDWGELLDGEEVVHAFRVHNDGDAPLTLNRIKPG